MNENDSQKLLRRFNSKLFQLPKHIQDDILKKENEGMCSKDIAKWLKEEYLQFLQLHCMKNYEYVVNGKHAIEWILERYQIKTDKDSGITNDPNLYAQEIGKPDYILNLLFSVIAVSVKTTEIVEKLPVLKW